MPGTVVSETPSVSLSFANNFWGKDDAGVQPLIERMHNAKVTCDEIKAFYSARAAIEDEYARKLLSLSHKPLGSSEAGTLKMSLDVTRSELESIAKSHQNIAAQMKSELEEPLSAFAGGLKERRKIVQSCIEKLLRVKIQQTNTVTKTRDRYEQDCLKIKGYLAQGHMVMGHEERKNKAKLEKTQIQLATSSKEYESAVKILEETTGRWNREWKAACDKFQDLEEERLDFMKSSLWSFANIASTVCVSDDASCEKIRLSLEGCEVEKDINNFIREKGTGQEIPDPPKYINFCRGDINDSASEASEDDYTVAQFQRTINPAFRTSSPQPSTYESHHDAHGIHENADQEAKNLEEPEQRQPAPAPVPAPAQGASTRPTAVDYQRSIPNYTDYDQPRPVNANTREQPMAATHPNQMPTRPMQLDYRRAIPAPADLAKHEALATVPHNEYPPDGMTMYCRAGPPSERSSAASPARPSSRDSFSEYSNPTSMSSQEPMPIKKGPIREPSAEHYSRPSSSTIIAPSPQALPPLQTSPGDDGQDQKKRGSFFQSRSPFRRRSKHDQSSLEQSEAPVVSSPTNRNTWGSAPSRQRGDSNNGSLARRPGFGASSPNMLLGGDRRSGSPEPVDPRANFQLNVGNNVFDVASPDKRKKLAQEGSEPSQEELDPIAQALAELKGVKKEAASRISADRYHGLATPIPPATPGAASGPSPMAAASASAAAKRGTPPPSYERPVKMLDPPKPAFTSSQMQRTTRKYVGQTQNMFKAPTEGSNPYERRPPSRPGTRGSQQAEETLRAASPGPSRVPRAASPAPPRPASRAASPAPPRSVSPRPYLTGEQRSTFRSTSPNPYAAASNRPRAMSSSPIKRAPESAYGYHNRSYTADVPRAVSPQPQFKAYERPNSSGSSQGMQLQLAPTPDGGQYGDIHRARTPQSGATRPMTLYGGSSAEPNYSTAVTDNRSRSRSIAESRQFTRDGRQILYFARALYMYQAAIPEELSFAKGDVLAVLALQDDGWFEAEVVGKHGRAGLVPSNYLQNC
ncbi:hypothetical protein L228DRAFT_263627 [Xylona heveae TC161]|uniref:SH3 domain-containing protein n=1 Tax=Xylona heveae (strain CBS 132557 / TC161) TaxID=1328760 RepID=A0A165A0G4_XYLHT|nr:hypothetical protein L228DRAFT_263627 [Xylona heveae TC161]KZF19774.1 hypothetical protein L228DRAFT_263627 [Xylona heveae TC161]